MSESTKKTYKAEPVNESGIDSIASEFAKNTKLIRILTHVGAIFFFIFPPLIVYLVSSDKEVKDTAKEVLNFEITVAILFVIATILFATIVGIIIAFPLYGLTALGQIILPIIGAIKVSEGGKYRYPFTIRFIK